MIAVLVVPHLAVGHEVIRDLEYAVAEGVSLRLDLYVPEDPGGLVPLVLWVHGGAWRAGDKDPTYAPTTLGEGYAIASISYRLSQEALFPAQIHDVKAAVRFLRGNADRYGLDPDRFGAWGSSAGGHLVALLGTSCGIAEAEGSLGVHLDQSSCVQAVCDFFGPTDFLVLLDERGGRDARRSMPEDQLLGGPVEENVELATLASPVTHVDPSDPPFLIMHGSEDSTVPVEQSIAFDEVLREAGVSSTLIVVEGAGHGFPREHLVHVKLFFDEHLAQQQSDAPVTSPENAVSGRHVHGQTFLTWKETDASAYAIYRVDRPVDSAAQLDGAVPLAIVEPGSSLNVRATEVEGAERRFVLPGEDEPLDEGVGLYVHTTESVEDVHYTIGSLDARGALVGIIGSTGSVLETVDAPQPVLQSQEVDGDCIRMRFAQWAPHGGPENPQALANRPGLSLNFVVRKSLAQAAPTGALFLLHGGGGDYDNRTSFPEHPDLLLVSPESVIPDRPPEVDRNWDAWYGYNEYVGTELDLSGGINVDYTTRWLCSLAEWLPKAFPSVSPNRLYLRGSSMGGVGTVFSAILLRDVFAAGVAIVPRFDYGADDIPIASQLTFSTRWGPFDENVLTSDGIGVLDRLDAGFLARENPDWDFAPVWAFNGRNDEAVGWSEKIPFYEAMETSKHGWAFFWDERAHGGQSPEPRAWRENGTEEAVFDWIVETIRLDQAYPAFSNCTIDDDPGEGGREEGDPVGTINGYLRWDPTSILDTADRFTIELALQEDAPTHTCTADVTLRRRQAFLPSTGTSFHYAVRDITSGSFLGSGVGTIDAWGLLTMEEVPVSVAGTRLIVERE